MVNRPEIRPTDDYKVDVESVVQAHPFKMEDCIIVPASKIVFGDSIDQSGTSRIVIALMKEDAFVGMSRTLSARQARMAAQSLIAIAEQIEGDASKQAEDALQRARKGGQA